MFQILIPTDLRRQNLNSWFPARTYFESYTGSKLLRKGSSLIIFPWPFLPPDRGPHNNSYDLGGRHKIIVCRKHRKNIELKNQGVGENVICLEYSARLQYICGVSFYLFVCLFVIGTTVCLCFKDEYDI